MTEQHNTSVALEETKVQELATHLRGTLLRPGEAGYEEARQVYNAMINKRPALIARCVDVADVMAAVTFAREHELAVAVRGGGHSGPGLGTCDDGLVIDLSGMKGIRVDPSERTAGVEGGCTWGEVDHATHAFGLATPSGFVSTTGAGGLTLGGGIGYLSRTLGLTIGATAENWTKPMSFSNPFAPLSRQQWTLPGRSRGRCCRACSMRCIPLACNGTGRPTSSPT